MAEIPSILLAAGSSSRMGSPKQLLPWGDKTLIEHQIGILKSLTKNIIVVLGAHYKSILPIVEKYDAEIVLNNDWEAGMGSSISNGIRKIMADHSSAQAALIALADQPLVTAIHFLNLLSGFNTEGKNIVISRSPAGWEGVPVVFDSCYFEELAVLTGETGAKRLINRYRQNVKVVNCDEILDDVDTPEKYQSMLAVYKNR